MSTATLPTPAVAPAQTLPRAARDSVEAAQVSVPPLVAGRGTPRPRPSTLRLVILASIGVHVMLLTVATFYWISIIAAGPGSSAIAVRSPVTVPELVADPVPEPLNRTVPELAPPQAPPVVLVAADRDREVVDDIDYSALEDPFQGPSMNWAIGVGGGGHSGGGTAGKGEADPASAPGVPEKPAGATRKARKIASLCAAPSYPKRERRRGVEGVVKVRVHIDADGHVLEVELLESSGSRGLDEAALEAVEGWTFEPALKDGTAVDAWATTDIRFGLS